jgi:hypothetical protein
MLTFKGVLRLQRGPSWDEFPFECPNSLGQGPWRYRAEWPYEEFAVENSEGDIVSRGVVAHLHAWVVGWPTEAIKHDVVYVGQAFGRHGERTAWDRLKRHETVQRVLAETPPDLQVWLTLASISDLNVFPEIDPRFPTQKSSTEDDEHIDHVIGVVYNDAFKDKEAVALAEAGLIRYFRPHYNDRMKYTFPARKQVSLESIRNLDFHGLIVELQTDHIDLLYGSGAAGYAYDHFWGFAIHQDANRAGTLTLAAADIAFGMPPTT